MKYLFVTSGKISKEKKGIVSSSIGCILQSYGYTPTYLKINPFLNYNSGKLEPSEHGETFVLNDGTEVDLSLAVFQKICNVILSNANCITGGNLLLDVINIEKQGDFNGKILRFCTEFTNYISNRLKVLANTEVCTIVDKKKTFKYPDAVIIELDGSLLNEDAIFFVKSFSRIYSELESSDKCFILSDSIFESEGTLDTNSVYDSLYYLKFLGLSADILIYSSPSCLDDSNISQISEYSGISKNSFIWQKENKFVYSYPQSFLEGGLYDRIKLKLKFNDRLQLFCLKENFFRYLKVYGKTKKVGIISRYDRRDNPYYCVEDALVIAGKKLGWDIVVVYINYVSLAQNDKDSFDLLKSVNGILIPGGFGNSHIDTKVLVANYARTNNIPCLGICLGFQLMIIEFCRNILGYVDATSEEFDEAAKIKVIRKHPEIVCKNTSSDIFLGEYHVNSHGSTKEIYQSAKHPAIFRHRYSLNPVYETELNSNGLIIEGKTEDSRAVVFSYEKNTFHKGVQYHPELSSTPDSIDPIFEAFISAVIGNLK